MKRLAIITMQLKTPGGIERFVSTLASMFADDFEVEIIANYGKPTDSLAFPLPKNVKLTFLTPVQPAEVSMKCLITHPTKWAQIPAELRRRHKITATQHRVFHKFFHNYYTDFIITDRALCSRLVATYYHGPALKIATDHNFHQHDPTYINELLSSIRSFDYLIVATDELRDFYRSRTKVKCLTIPNPLPSIPTEKSPLTTKNLISVGRLVPEKDFDLLIDAMKIVRTKDPDIHLTIVGDGSEKPTLKSKIKSLGLTNTITLTGWLPQSAIAKLYLKSSLFVMTSKTEAFGLVLTEAMSYGLPCLALSRASGARALITKNTGMLLDTATKEALATEILHLLSHPALLQDYQSHLPHHIKQYTPTTIKSSWLSVMQPKN